MCGEPRNDHGDPLLCLHSVWPGFFCADLGCVWGFRAASEPRVAACVRAERPLACSGWNGIQEEEKERGSVCEEVCPHWPYLCRGGPQYDITSQRLGKYSWWNAKKESARIGLLVGLGTRLHSMTLSLWWECLSSSAGLDSSVVSPRALFSICTSEAGSRNRKKHTHQMPNP